MPIRGQTDGRLGLDGSRLMLVTEIDPATDRAGKVRRILGQAVKRALDQHGDGLAGFALVSWDMLGDANSAYFTEFGMVGEGLMPTYVHDALNRHLAAVIVERSQTYRVTDPAG